MAQRDVLAVGILISLCGSGMGWWGAWVPPFVLMPRGRAQVGFIPQGWAAAVFQVMEKQVFPSFLSKNTCLELGICSQTQEKTDLGLPRAGGHQEALSGCQRAGAPGACSPALGAPRHGWGWGAGVNSSTRRTRGPGAQSLVSERPKRGCPGDSMYVRGTQDRAWAQRVWLGLCMRLVHVERKLRGRTLQVLGVGLVRVTFSAAASQTQDSARSLAVGPRGVPCAPMPHFCIGLLLGDAGVDPTGSEGASLCPCRLGPGQSELRGAGTRV